MHKEFKYRDKTFRLGIHNYYNDIFYFDVEDSEGNTVSVTFYQDDIDRFVEWLNNTVDELRKEWWKNFEERMKKCWGNKNG